MCIHAHCCEGGEVGWRAANAHPTLAAPTEIGAWLGGSQNRKPVESQGDGAVNSHDVRAGHVRSGGGFLALECGRGCAAARVGGVRIGEDVRGRFMFAIRRLLALTAVQVP